MKALITELITETYIDDATGTPMSVPVESLAFPIFAEQMGVSLARTTKFDKIVVLTLEGAGADLTSQAYFETVAKGLGLKLSRNVWKILAEGTVPKVATLYHLLQIYCRGDRTETEQTPTGTHWMSLDLSDN